MAHAFSIGTAMRYVFDVFELDPGQNELRRHGTAVPIEPQVFSLLLLLISNRERMVSKDEIVEQIWGGRAISDTAISSRIKSARRAIGDDGKQQRCIRTIHGKGLRFVADVCTVVPGDVASPNATSASALAPKPEGLNRPSIAILPLRILGAPGHHSAIGEAIAHDLIASLSRLRWLFVIARGSSFRFQSADFDAGELGRLLNVSYCFSGVVEIFGPSMTVIVELLDTRTDGVLWGDHYTARLDDIHIVRSRIVSEIMAALEIQIPLNEASLAALAGPENLDAWSAYHLGLQHLFRFNGHDNAKAGKLFERAIAIEPRFARAHAGLSSTCFQSAFLRYSGDAEKDATDAHRSAARSVELDPVDPFANLTMGRAFWLQGDLEGSLSWLDRSTSLSPNYAQGFYARAWADTISGRDLDGTENVNAAMALSPLDPFRYAMLATRALICLAHGETADGADWADKAACSPGAHVLIAMIAVIGHALNGDARQAALWAEKARSQRGDLSRAHFFASFPFKEGQFRHCMERALSDNGF